MLNKTKLMTYPSPSHLVDPLSQGFRERKPFYQLSLVKLPHMTEKEH
jgi:fructosamine-3-kinase